MDVATITMPPEAAREKLREDRRAPHPRTDEEYQRAAVASEALAEGTPLLLLSEVINRAPLDEKGRPRLAIARADRTQIRYQCLRTWQGERFHRFNSTITMKRPD